MNAPISSITPGVLASSHAAEVTLAAPCGRLSIRARGDVAPFSAALGLSLPGKIGSIASNGETRAICLGPDEWALHMASDAVPTIIEAFAGLYAENPHSLVDISGREISLLISGPQATDLLTIGTPRDIASIPVGEGRRTLFDCATVVLWRSSETRFQMDIWNSFAPHLIGLLKTGCAEFALTA
ncbi:sarcosine oxidase subunit gamma [Cohaesibacter sp. ES.047]|uniref:sarcosine oxidase subunit gamma n=1 Tax=Cohaesibacter sp. ES.047 TaxID=1798205 RepID=UPI000BB75822|nr:sarcosine oxidase subunit gamma family protein [Cohaesibacter sp. ES.047]SNY94141.1 sarcosine oxidase subunit gamma [Cohaesibacter sp. ES.047]